MHRKTSEKCDSASKRFLPTARKRIAKIIDSSLHIGSARHPVNDAENASLWRQLTTHSTRRSQSSLKRVRSVANSVASLLTMTLAIGARILVRSQPDRLLPTIRKTPAKPSTRLGYLGPLGVPAVNAMNRPIGLARYMKAQASKILVSGPFLPV